MHSNKWFNIVNRDWTERIESVEEGIVQLLDLSQQDLKLLAGRAIHAIESRTARPPLQHTIKLYGDGFSGVRSCCRMARYLGITASLDNLACGVDSPGHSDFEYEGERPLVDRNVIRDGDVEERRAVRELSEMDISTHPKQLFKPYYTQGRISVILTQYKRNTTEMQLRHLFRQTVFSKIDRIVIFQNLDFIDLSFLRHIDFSIEVLEQETSGNRKYLRRNMRKRKREYHDIIEIVKSPQYNYKYYGRFSLALLFDSEFTIVFDDDTIPQPRWLELSTELSGKMNAIIGPVGIIVGRDRQFFLNPPMDFHTEVYMHNFVFCYNIDISTEFYFHRLITVLMHGLFELSG